MKACLRHILLILAIAYYANALPAQDLSPERLAVAPRFYVPQITNYHVGTPSEYDTSRSTYLTTSTVIDNITYPIIQQDPMPREPLLHIRPLPIPNVHEVCFVSETEVPVSLSTGAQGKVWALPTLTHDPRTVVLHSPPNPTPPPSSDSPSLTTTAAETQITDPAILPRGADADISSYLWVEFPMNVPITWTARHGNVFTISRDADSRSVLNRILHPLPPHLGVDSAIWTVRTLRDPLVHGSTLAVVMPQTVVTAADQPINPLNQVDFHDGMLLPMPSTTLFVPPNKKTFIRGHTLEPLEEGVILVDGEVWHTSTRWSQHTITVPAPTSRVTVVPEERRSTGANVKTWSR